jgi:hypothetical protein
MCLREDSQPPGRVLNPRPSKYEKGVISSPSTCTHARTHARPRCLVSTPEYRHENAVFVASTLKWQDRMSSGQIQLFPTNPLPILRRKDVNHVQLLKQKKHRILHHVGTSFHIPQPAILWLVVYRTVLSCVCSLWFQAKILELVFSIYLKPEVHRNQSLLIIRAEFYSI